jgi:hypothetical protein
MLAERLATKVESCESLAAAHHSLPPLLAVPLPNGPDTGETFPFPSLTSQYDLQVSFGRDGSLRGISPQKSQMSMSLLAVTVATFPTSVGDRSFGLVVNREECRKQIGNNWRAWADFAREIAPILWTFPETGASSFTNPVSAVLAYVFQSAYINRQYVSQHDGILAVKNLWGATLLAISMRQGNQFVDQQADVSKDAPKRPHADAASSNESRAKRGGLTVDQAFRALWNDPRTDGWSGQEFANALGCSKAAVMQSRAWKERQADLKQAKASKEQMLRSKASQLDAGHNRSQK